MHPLARPRRKEGLPAPVLPVRGVTPSPWDAKHDSSGYDGYNYNVFIDSNGDSDNNLSHQDRANWRVSTTVCGVSLPWPPRSCIKSPGCMALSLADGPRRGATAASIMTLLSPPRHFGFCHRRCGYSSGCRRCLEARRAASMTSSRGGLASAGWTTRSSKADLSPLRHLGSCHCCCGIKSGCRRCLEARRVTLTALPFVGLASSEPKCDALRGSACALCVGTVVPGICLDGSPRSNAKLFVTSAKPPLAGPSLGIHTLASACARRACHFVRVRIFSETAKRVKYL